MSFLNDLARAAVDSLKDAALNYIKNFFRKNRWGHQQNDCDSRWLLANQSGLPRIAGIYIIQNHFNGRTYVGQSVDVYKRCAQHFKGKGSKELGFDIQQGYTYQINFIALQGSGFRNLNDLEKFYITQYNAFHHGYNKTRGNS